ncbi:MAG: SDR family oxidoreductase [Gammaproteobacteria bacterium]
MKNIKNQVVLITGASSGFGMLTAQKVVSFGGKVILGARREDKLKDLANELGEDNVVYAKTDMSNLSQVKNLAKVGLDKFGRIDALVNNAGIMPLSLIGAGRTDEWDAMIDTNIKGVLYGVNAVYDHMMQRGSGKIINISSVAGKRVMPGGAVYSGTKFAVHAISEGIRMESAGKIQVSCIYPGAFMTELAGSIKDESMLEALMARGIGKIAGDAGYVADAILFALSQDAAVAINDITLSPTATP